VRIARQSVKNKRTAKLKAKREREERMKQLQEVCESNEEASVALHALTGDCLICLNKLFQADEGEWGAVKLQCTGCTRSPILHVSCMVKLQNQRDKCPQCRQPFSNARATAAAARDYASEWDDDIVFDYSSLAPFGHGAYAATRGSSPAYSPNSPTSPAYNPPSPPPPPPRRYRSFSPPVRLGAAALAARRRVLEALSAPAPSTRNNGEPLYTVAYYVYRALRVILCPGVIYRGVHYCH
jgi:hypothetical protein